MAAMIEILEVGPRDGLQNEPEIVATKDKVALIERLAAMGARRIEVASFVNPKRVPQMGDAESVIAGLPPRAQRSYAAIGLCLNERGVRRAIKTEVDEAGCVMFATDSFGIRNQGQNVEEGIAANSAMLSLARDAGLKPQVTISTSFGCPFEGRVAPAKVIDIAQRMIDAGAEEVALADTIGVAVPQQVSDLFGRLAEVAGEVALRCHFHDTRGLAPANAWAAYQAGAQTFDASLGGLGGCPFAPGATGNVATEDLTYLFEQSGIATNIDLAKAIEANRWFAGIMGRALPSRVGRAGDFAVSA